MVDIA